MKGTHMTVQIQPARPKDQHNGLEALEDDLLDDQQQTVTAIVTYAVAKIVDDLKKDERYPVVYVKHIEPIVGADREAAEALQQAAYKARTGEDQLDLDFAAEDAEGEE